MTTATPQRPAVKDSVTQYAQSVIDGDLVAGRLVRMSCQRHLDDLQLGSSRGLFFDADKAQKAITFFSYLKHYKGEWAGQPLQLEPWQQFIIGSLFGWLRADRSRRFRIAYNEIPRKNGKSLIAAGVGLLLAFFDKEGGAEVYSAATKRDQAKIVWGDAKTMVKASPDLRKVISMTGGETGVGTLFRADTASKFVPLGADGDTMDGLNIHGAIIDELHAHKTRVVWDVIQTGTGARRQPLTFVITTAGFDRNSVCYEQHDYGIKVLEGVIPDDTVFVYIATMDDGDDWTDPTSWAKANPNYGVSVKIDDLERKCQKARQVPTEQNEFLRKHLNVWTEASERWLNMELWDENAGPTDSRDMREALRGRKCWAGIDLSSNRDLSAVTLAFLNDDGAVDVLTFPFLPEDGIRERSEQDRVPYEVWADQGFLSATEGNSIDYDYIRNLMNDLADQYEFQEVGYDPWNAEQMAIKLRGDGFNVVPIRQGFASLTAPSKELERLLLAKKLRHGNHPVLRWAASNAIVHHDPADNIKPDKPNVRARIDPLAALVTALARVILKGEEVWHGIYLGETEEPS